MIALETVVLGASAVVLLVQLGLAARAVIVERRVGLAPSWGRLAALGGMGLILLAAIVGPRLLAAGPSVAPAAPPTLTTAQALRADELERLLTDQRALLARKDAEVAALLVEVEALRAELQTLRPSSAPPSASAKPRGDVTAAVAALLALLGFAPLLLLGDPSTLVPAFLRWRGGKQEAARKAALELLDDLAAAAGRGAYPEGVKLAARVPRELLDRLETLDLLFLDAFCAVGLAHEGEGGRPVAAERRRELLDGARTSLERLVQLAPLMGEAEHLLAHARFMTGDMEGASAGFVRAEKKLGPGSDLPYAHNRSVCLLELAEQRLQKADPEGANRLFDEVAKLGALAGQIPLVLVENRLLQVRDGVRQGRFEEVKKGIELVRAVEGLDAAARKSANLSCEVLEVVALFKEGDLAESLARATALLARLAPKGLPDVSDQAAEDFLFPATEGLELALPLGVLRALQLLRAVVLVRLHAKTGRAPTPLQVDELAEPLLRALQYAPRDRDALAALGGLYYWCFPTKRERALAWLEAAVSLGVASPTARRILERDRGFDRERRGVIDQFIRASARYLDDPTLSAHVRKALIQELGLFQEFQPLLLELEDQVEAPARSPTLESLRERARYVDGLVVDVLRHADPRLDPARVQALGAIRSSYVALAEGLERQSTELEALERRVMTETGRLFVGRTA